MKSLFTTEQIRNLDNFAINKIGFPSILLMENATNSILNIISDFFKTPLSNKSFSIFCGKGNNGGDGIALARKLVLEGSYVYLHLLFPEKNLSPDAATNLRILKSLRKEFKNFKIILLRNQIEKIEFEKTDFVVDAILGSGSTGSLDSFLKSLIEKMNSSFGKKIAIDIPTGLNSSNSTGDVLFNADLTVSLGGLKDSLFYGKGYECSGEVRYGDIGISPKIIEKSSKIKLVEIEDLVNLIPKKRKTINKYSSGKCNIVAGSAEYPGAPLLTAKSAMKTGSGAVTLHIPEKLKIQTIKSFSEVVIKSYSNSNYLTLDSLSEIQDGLSKSDTVIIGPGLGRNKETFSAVDYFLLSNEGKKVIDADALFALSQFGYKNYDLSNAILTPHLGEFANLINAAQSFLAENIIKLGKDFVKETKSILVLKGPSTLVFGGDELFISTLGNRGLAKFGTGDVLAGMIGSFSAQGASLLESALAGVILHSFCSELIKNSESSYTLTASDLIKTIPNAFKKLGI